MDVLIFRDLLKRYFEWSRLEAFRESFLLLETTTDYFEIVYFQLDAPRKVSSGLPLTINAL